MIFCFIFVCVCISMPFFELNISTCIFLHALQYQSGRRTVRGKGLGCQFGDREYCVFMECLEEIALA